MQDTPGSDKRTEKKLPPGGEKGPQYNPVATNSSGSPAIDTTPPEVFRNFVSAGKRVFDFLVSDYGFEYLGWEIEGRECTISFAHRPNVALMFSYEPCSTPMASVFGRLRPDREQMVHKTMQALARQRLPGWNHPMLENADTSVTELARVLTVYADLLREHFPEVLAAPDGLGLRLQKGIDSS